ncbi:MAG: PAS domain-containing sensor histidine kinase [Myxococcales bacterium]
MSAEDYRELFECSAVGQALLSSDGKLLEANAALQRMLGRSADALRRLGLEAVVHPDDAAADRELLRELLDGERDAYQTDKRFVREDGHVVWCHVSVSALRGADGKVRLLSMAFIDVSSAKALEAKLAESQRRYFDLFENALVAIFRTGTEKSDLLEANRRAADLVGATDRGGLVGFKTTDFYTRPGERERMLAQLRANKGRPVEFELPLRALDGRIVWVHGVARLSSDGTYVDVVAFDVTERRRLEEERAASERRLGIILETIPSGLLLIDERGVVTFANQATEQMLGRSRNEFSGWRHDDPRWRLALPDGSALPPDKLPFAAVRKTGRPVHGLELSAMRSDGERRILLVNAAPLPPPVGGVVVSFSDVTRRKRAEDELRQQRRQLDNVIDLNPFGIAVFDIEGHFLRWNRAFEKMFGGEPPLGYSVFSDPVLKRAGAIDAVRRALRGETVDTPAWWYNPRWADPRAPDKLVFVHTITFPVFDAEGQVEGFAVMYEDATEKKRMEDDLLRAKEGAEAADRAKTEFLSIASHELRTPLTPLRLLVQLSRRRLAKGVPVTDVTLEKMERHIARLVELVTGLLDVSRLTRGVLTLDKRRVDLRKLVAEVVEDFRAAAPERSLRLEAPSEPVFVLADPTRIEQVLSNLIDNALRYSPPSSPVEVKLELQGDKAKVSVADFGPGIREDLRDRIFSGVLVGESGPSRQPGLGMGLFVARNLVELHGGTIGFRSVRGEGSTFFFTLPLAPAPEDPSAPASAGGARPGEKE